MTKTIYVIDPGMMEAGGHHAALLETLTESEHHGAQISIFTHEKLDDKLAEKARNCGITVIRHFKTNFYQHYEDSLELKISAMQGYIRYLAWEYLQALQFITQQNTSDNPICFYPCMNWEHASALSLVMSLSDKWAMLTHKVCCMFKPLINDERSKLYYKSAFGQLNKYQTVSLYASDWETREYYQHIGVSISGFHPCYLLPWNYLDTSKKEISNLPHLLLYMGDAKVNKGFLILPETIRKAIALFKGKVKLIVQYTIAWDYPEIEYVLRELTELESQYDEQLTIYRQFWSKSELQEVLTTLSGIVCTYKPDAYQNKSSGLAWLSAFYCLPIVFLTEKPFWMERELDRLNCQYLYSFEAVSELKIKKETGRNSYYDTLYQDLIGWL